MGSKISSLSQDPPAVSPWVRRGDGERRHGNAVSIVRAAPLGVGVAMQDALVVRRRNGWGGLTGVHAGQATRLVITKSTTDH